MLNPQSHGTFLVCENRANYQVEFCHQKNNSGNLEYVTTHLWRVYIHGLNREVFVMAPDEDGAKSQASCKHSLDGLTVTIEKQPFLIRGWSSREF